MTSERTISQVRAILNKLDRSIDEAREKRCQPPAPPAAEPTPAFAATSPSPIAAQGAAPQTATSDPSPTGFGRAQPLRPQATNILRFGHQ